MSDRKGFELCKKHRDEFPNGEYLLMCIPHYKEKNQVSKIFICYPNEYYTIYAISATKLGENHDIDGISIVQWRQEETPIIPVDKEGVVRAWHTISGKKLRMGLSVPGIGPTVDYILTGSRCFVPKSEKAKSGHLWRLLYGK